MFKEPTLLAFREFLYSLFIQHPYLKITMQSLYNAMFGIHRNPCHKKWDNFTKEL